MCDTQFGQLCCFFRPWGVNKQARRIASLDGFHKENAQEQKQTKIIRSWTAYYMISLLRTAVLCLFSLLATSAALAQDPISIGANVNMVSGKSFPNGDPFQRQQNEPSVAFSSRNNLHLLAGANDYRAVDVPGLPGGRETGDSWLSYFWSTNGGATWKSTLMPGYPQDPACLTSNRPVLCDYAAGADPVVRAGVNGMFYYSGIVFERTDPSRSAIFVSRFIDLNNDEGGDPIRYLDTTIIDANNDGSEFLDKSWIGVDIPHNTGSTLITETIDVVQRDDSIIQQTVACGNVYVGYAAISGEGQDLRSEIRMATSTDCGNNWDIQPISEPDSLNQGANIAIHPTSGKLHVVWRRFDTVESFLGISPTGCPASPSAWEINDDWPVSSITLAGVTYTIEEAQDLLGRKHRGDESIKLAYEVIAAKLNLLTGGGDPVPGFNPWIWAEDLNGLIEDAEAWFALHPIGSDPKQADKKAGQNIKKNIQEILQGSGSCSGGGTTTTSTTGETNAIMAVTSDDFGQTFSDPVVINESTTFDQGSTRFTFRTTAYPTVAVDKVGRIYVAWAARGIAMPRSDELEGDARIVLSTSIDDGENWSPPYAVDEPNHEGHQIKPSLLFAGGQLTLVFYDFREDVSSIFEGFVIDLPEPGRLRHSVDVRVATASPGLAPEFTNYSLSNPSNQASRYAFVTTADYTTVQLKYMVPNLPMFADGTTPFIGDYVDVAAPNLINDDGEWRFASDPGDVQVWQAVWSDNRDVTPPPDGDWGKYVAPITGAQPSQFDPTVTIPSCNDVFFLGSDFPAGSLYTGTRNQNVYSASISNGVIVAAPGNNRPFGFDDTGAPLERAFVVYVQNTTSLARQFRVSLADTPIGVDASLAPDVPETSKDIEIPAYSSAVATVFASTNGTPISEPIPVRVEEIGGSLQGTVLLNSDPGAPDPLDVALLTGEVHNPVISNPVDGNLGLLDPTVSTEDAAACAADPVKCVLNPAVLNPAVLNPAVFNPAVLNPAVFNPAVFNPAVLNPAVFNPAILNPAIFNPAVLNPAVFNPAVLNPAVLNPAVLNPAVLNPAVFNPAVLNPAVLNPAILNATPAEAGLNQVDVTFAVSNEGTSTTAYNLDLAAPQIEGLDYDLIVYRLNETPITDGCTLTTEAQQQLIFNQTDPLNTGNDGSFYLEPGEEVLVTFRVRPDFESDTPLDPVTAFNPDDLGAIVSSQPLNTNPATQPPADEFGPPATIVPATAGGTVVGGGGTDPINAGTLAPGEQVVVTATGFVLRGAASMFEPNGPNGSGPCGASCVLQPSAPLSIAFNNTNNNVGGSGNNNPTGEPSNTDGLQLPGQIGPWEDFVIGNGWIFTQGNSLPSPSINVGGITFTLDTLGNGYETFNPPVGNDDLRRAVAFLRSGAFSWSLTGLADGALYDLILFGQENGANPANFSILGHDAGNGIGGAVTNDSEADGNFRRVQALAGTISGAFGLKSGESFAGWSGLQLEPTTTALGLVARIGGGPWQFVGEGPTILTSATGGDIEFAINDDYFSDNSGAFYVTATPVPGAQVAAAFTETVITGDSSILNDGTLIAANDLGAAPDAVTVNGVSFGTDQSGLTGPWGPGGGDFSVDSFSANLDALLSDLQFSGTLSPVTFTLGGLTPGTAYRLQLLISNDLNSTGDRVEVTIQGETWMLDDWQPDAVNLIANFTAAGPSVDVTFTPGTGSTTESGRAVLNAYAIHEASPFTGVTITSISPSTGSNGGAGSGLIVARGVNLPPPSTDMAVISNGTTTQNGFVFQSPSTTSGYWIRIPAGFPVGPATLQIQGGTAPSNAFPFTVATTHGTPVITNILDAGTVPTTSISSGDTIYVQVDGMDTLGWVVRFTQGANSWTATPGGGNSAVSSNALGLTARVVVPGGLVTGSVDIDVSQAGSGFSTPVTLTVP